MLIAHHVIRSILNKSSATLIVREGNMLRRAFCAVIAFSLVFVAFAYSHAAGPKLVYGPATFERTVGGPDSFTATFTACDPAGSFTIVVDNGDADGKHRVSSASVHVNGMPVVTQSDFNQKVGRIERPLSGVMEQNTVEVRMQSAPGSKMNVSVMGVMRCLEVHIESPADGETLSEYGAIVTGTVEAQEGAEVGVTVNGVPAEVCGLRFAAVGVPLAEGGNTITAVAADDTGNTAEDTVKVALANPEASQVHLSAYPTAGQAPLEVGFDVSVTLLKAAVLYELDYEGDGTVEVSAQDLDGLLSSNAHVFESEGLYFPTLQVSDADGNIFSSKIIVNVFPMPDLAKKWDGMRAALKAGSIETAVSYFALGTREGYTNMFRALADAGALADAVSRMGEVRVVETMGNAAEGDMRVIEDGKEYSFYVLFVKDDDGIWRIRSF